MLITSRDRLEPRSGEHTYTLRFTLPANRDPLQDDALAEHIDSFVRLYLTRFDARSTRAARTGPLRWMLVSGSQKMAEMEKVRAELEVTLFGSGDSGTRGQAILVETPAENEDEAYIPAMPEGSAAADLPAQAGTVPGPADGPDALREELAAFRADMREIAASFHGADMGGTLDTFRAGLDALAQRMEAGISEAAGRVEGAAERIDMATARLPDADRLELALTRNDASAALITNGLQESLKLLLKAVEGLERQNAGGPKLLDRLGREAA
jgi:hypothetical protein